MYLEYYEFLGFGGDYEKLSETAFEQAEFRARKRIDRATYGRVKDMETVPEAVKRCVYALINADGLVGTEAQIENPLMTSYSTDGYQETYGNALKISDAEASLDMLVRQYLYGEVNDKGVPLLYRGVEA